MTALSSLVPMAAVPKVAANFRGLKDFLKKIISQSSFLKRPRKEGSSSPRFVILIDDEVQNEDCRSSSGWENSFPPRVPERNRSKVPMEGTSNQVPNPQVNLLLSALSCYVVSHFFLYVPGLVDVQVPDY